MTNFSEQRKLASAVIMRNIGEGVSECRKAGVSPVTFSLTLADHAMTLLALDLAMTKLSDEEAKCMIETAAAKLAIVGEEQFYEAKRKLEEASNLKLDKITSTLQSTLHTTHED